MNPEELQQQVDQIDAVLRARAPGDFLQFLQAVTIPSATGPQRLRDCIVPFQQEFFEDIAHTLHAIRDGKMPPARRFWLERTKKASKDGDIALCILWLMAYPKRPVLVQVCAANQKQSGIIKRRVQDILYYNPWLHPYVKVVQNKIQSKDIGETIIEATGSSGGAQGETPDLLILNELVHVERWSVMETHMNNADGVPQGVVVISTNAGFKGTPAHKWRGNALANQYRWRAHIWHEKAPWVDPMDMDESKARNKGSEYKRLWKGLWVSGKGDAVSEEAIARCFDNNLQQLYLPEKGWRYIGGLDLGVSHDHSALVFLGVNTELMRIRLAWMRNWAPNKSTGKIDLMDVQNQVYLQSRAFKAESVWADPYEAELMMQQLLKKQTPIKERTFKSSTSLTLMATAFQQCVENGTLECYDDADGTLRRDFGKFDMIERASGLKLEAVSDEFGHADVGTALVICLPRALEMLGVVLGALQPDEELGWGASDQVELSKEEVEDMPDLLRGIYEAEPEPEGRGRKKRHWISSDY